MEIIAETIEQLLEHLNNDCPANIDFYYDEDSNEIIQDDLTGNNVIHFSYETKKHSISGKNIFVLYC